MSSTVASTESELVIRTLYEIAAEYDRGFEHQVKRLLQLGLTRFNLEIGILASIHEDTYTVVHQVSPDELPLQDGTQFPLGDTYCSITMEADEPVGFDHVGTSSIAKHPAYHSFGLEAYVGIPVKVDSDVYGTLNFSSPTPKPRAFSDVDIDTLKLMAVWVGSELSRRKTEMELLRAKEELEKQSLEDPLTCLFNRRGFEDRLARLARRCTYLKKSLAGIVIDVDDFKTINDRFGHSVGDKALIEIACAISHAVRPYDIVGRIGGDEFMVLLPECPSNKAIEIAEGVRLAVSDLHIQAESISIRPSISLGVFEVPPDLDSVTAALEASHASLKSAKSSGKNKVARLIE
jgi:diguanylate cyclase (GGDEF)-like protein